MQTSVGYQVRLTHRLIQRALQARIEPHGVTLGMWYYLRVLWDQDGLTQRELSRMVGTMEPTTLSAIGAMEKQGLVRRERNGEDRRKINVFLTGAGRALEAELLPCAMAVIETATKGLGPQQTEALLTTLWAMQRELRADLGEDE